MMLRFVQGVLVLFGIAAIVVILTPHHHNRDSARKMSCMSNLKQFGLAYQQYAQDNNDHLPSRSWGKLLLPYGKDEDIFSCPATTSGKGKSDYFFNARFIGKPLNDISSPATLILMGDGENNAPRDVTLSQLPLAWRTDENSPAWRHQGKATYLFADGHAKWLTVKEVDRNFRMVSK